MPLRFLIFVAIAAGFSNPVFSQILDDSTRLIYGSHTTKYVTEGDILNNTERDNYIDTTVNDFHNYDFVYKGKTVYQNLGNLGTPLNFIYYNPPQTIGRNFGFNSFDPYAFNSNKVRYYDTRSPYSSVYYMQGSTGQQIGKAEYSRNIKKNWNFGFEIRRFTSNKLIGATSQRDRLSDHTSFLFYSRYFTKDSTYQVLVNYSVMDHKNFETGGVKRDSAGETNETFFDYRLENVNLNYARSFEKRSAYHLYQQFAISNKAIQLYHVFDYYKQSNRFRDNPILDTIVYPDKPYYILPQYFNTGATDDRTDFSLFENRVGIKGDLNKIFYSAYYRRRDFRYKEYYLDSTKKYNENFIGGNSKYFITEKISLNVFGEYLFAANSKKEKDYLLRVEFVSSLIKAGYYKINYPPTLLQLRFTGNNFIWNNENSFSNTNSDNLYASGEFKLGNFQFSPAVNFSNINKYIFYNTLALPFQYQNKIQVLSIDMLVKFKWRWLNIENFTKYSSATQPDIIQIPELYNHGRIYFENKILKKSLLAQVGMDLFWKSNYYANIYMPVTQQYYLNNYFQVPSYLLADFFINFQVKKVNFFIKMSHFNQGFFGKGYFSTPYYPGLPRNFEFGIKWNFFD